MTINAVILIPEITKGMKSIGSKSLLKIKHDKYIIEYQIEQLLNIHKHINITVATGFDHDKIIKIIDRYNNINTLYNPNYENTNFGRSLELYMDKNPNIKNLLIIGSGILFKKNSLLANHLKHESKIFILDKPKHNFDIGCGPGTDLEYLFYDLPNMWTECVYLNESAIEKLKTIIKSKPIEQMYIFEIVNDLVSHNINFDKEFVSKSNFLKITSIKDLGKAKVFI